MQINKQLSRLADDAMEWYLSDLEVNLAYSKLEEAGATVVAASDEMRASWANAMENAAAKWAANLDADGKRGSDIMKLYMDTMRAAGATPLRNWDQE